MICYALFVSFLIGAIFPLLSLFFFPEIIHGKGIEAFTPYSSIYLVLLLIVFCTFLYCNKQSEVKFLKDSVRELSVSALNIKLSIFLLLILYLGRFLYAFIISDSPYTLLVNNGDMLVFGVLDRLINYFYIISNFKLYPLLQGIIILFLPRRFLPFFFIAELIYASLIFSKFIILINFIAILICYMHYKRIKFNRESFCFVVLSVVSSIILLFVLREVFGQLRQGFFSLERIEFYNLVVGGISRIQSVFSVFYAEKVLNDFLYGKTLCHIVGYVIPDSLVTLPLNCRNIDEPIVLYYFGLTDLRIIDKDLLTFWGEPFANFGIAGVLLFIFLIAISNLFTKKLGSNSYGLILVWVVLINCLMAHNSWSAIVGNIYLSFIFLWVLQQTCEWYDSN